MFSRIRSAIRSAVRRKKLEREMTEEMRFHLDAVELDFIAAGTTLSEARRRCNRSGAWSSPGHERRPAGKNSSAPETIVAGI